MATKWILAFLAGLAGLQMVAAAGKIQCVDDDNKPVDWVVAYKIPRMIRLPEFRSGYRYATVTPSTVAQGWKLSKKESTDKDSVFGLNFKVADSIGKRMTSLWWSDRPPVGATARRFGRSKGVLAADATGGMLMLHTLPRYVPGDKRLKPWHRAFGQMAVCISFDPKKDLEGIGEYIWSIAPRFYHRDVDRSASTPKLMEVVRDFSHRRHFQMKYWESSSSNMTTVGGEKVAIFGKSSREMGDLYSDFVAPMLQVSLRSATWPLAYGRKLQSDCRSADQVENINKISIPLADTKDLIVFSTRKDQSKWSVSRDPSSPWVCFGDLDRKRWQKTRGGAAMCIQNPALQKLFTSLVSGIDYCPVGPDECYASRSG